MDAATRRHNIGVLIWTPALFGAIAGGFFFAYQMYVILFSIMLSNIGG